MENGKPNFKKDLWGQCNKLHERLYKKIDYYKSLLKAFKPIHNSFSDLNEKINSMKLTMDPTIPVELYIDSKIGQSSSTDMETKWYSVPLTMKKIKDFIAESVDFNHQFLFHVVTNLENLINKMKQEKNEYEEFMKCLNSLSDSKKVMEKKMKEYHIKMFAAEQSVLDLKKLEVKTMSINDATIMMESKEISEQEALQLTNDALKPFKVYQESVDKANEIRKESIEKQKSLLFIYQNIEEEIGRINTTISNIFFSNLKIQKEFIEKETIEIDNIRNSINTTKDIKQLIINYTGKEEPEKEILFVNFSAAVDFDKSDCYETFRIYTETVEFIKEIVKNEYPNYNKQLEEEKNDMREITYKLFQEYSKDNGDKLLNYIKNEKKTHYFFLIILSKLRTNNRFQQKTELIDLLGIILNEILEVSEKEKNYDNAKNCIILSQTFFCDKNNEKYYLIEKIKNFKWLKSVDFWINFIDKMIEQEIDKFVNTHIEITKSDILNRPENINDKMKFKLSELLFSQLLPYVNNMNEFKLDLINIVEVTELFCEKYKFLGEEHKESIFGLVSNDKNSIEKLRDEYKKKKSNSYNKNVFDKNSSKDVNKKIGMNNGIIINNNIILNSNININPNLNKNSNSDKISTRDKINTINNKETNLNDNNNNINIINKNNLNNNKNKKSQEEIVRSYTTIGFDIQKNKYSNNEANNIIGTNNDKNANNNQGMFDNILTPLKKFGNFLKKEEKKEITQDSKKKIEKQEIFTRKDSFVERKAVMIKNVNNSLTSQGSPFGVTLKKIGSIK